MLKIIINRTILFILFGNVYKYKGLIFVYDLMHLKHLAAYRGL